MPNDKKFYLLSGSYGTGKSHLCLMLANVLGKSSDDPSLKGFYENYTKLDGEKAKQLKNVRKGGQFLVALCDYGSGRKFEDEVLRAIVEACQERGVDVAKFTEFDEAERKLDEWEKAAKEKKGVRDFYSDFVKALEQVAPGTPHCRPSRRTQGLQARSHGPVPGGVSSRPGRRVQAEVRQPGLHRPESDPERGLQGEVQGSCCLFRRVRHSHEEEVELSEKLDQVQAGAVAKKIDFTYTFDSSKHDRYIQTDTGWRILLGRGLDIFHRADGKYSLGFIDQSQRKCKETSITFTTI